MKIKTELIIDIPEDNDIHKFASFPIFQEIFHQDCYRINDIINSSDARQNVIWDIGSHLGFFSLLCALRIQKYEIHTFETLPIRVEEQRKILEKFNNMNINLCKFLGFVHDREKCKKFISRQDETVINQYIAEIKGVPFLSVEDYLKTNKVPDIIKIDMEGGEVGIIEELRELGHLSNVKIITGEWHFDLAYNYFKNELNDLFNVEIIRTSDNNQWNTFFAKNKNL